LETKGDEKIDWRCLFSVDEASAKEAEIAKVASRKRTAEA
jgi:hypothetical protein